MTIPILEHLCHRLAARRILDQKLVDLVSFAGLVHPLNQPPMPLCALAPKLPAHLGFALAGQPFKMISMPRLDWSGSSAAPIAVGRASISGRRRASATARSRPPENAAPPVVSRKDIGERLRAVRLDLGHVLQPRQGAGVGFAPPIWMELDIL
jgi:hypothetical protein